MGELHQQHLVRLTLRVVVNRDGYFPGAFARAEREGALNGGEIRGGTAGLGQAQAAELESEILQLPLGGCDGRVRDGHLAGVALHALDRDGQSLGVLIHGVLLPVEPEDTVMEIVVHDQDAAQPAAQRRGGHDALAAEEEVAQRTDQLQLERLVALDQVILVDREGQVVLVGEPEPAGIVGRTLVVEAHEGVALHPAAAVEGVGTVLPVHGRPEHLGQQVGIVVIPLGQAAATEQVGADHAGQRAAQSPIGAPHLDEQLPDILVATVAGVGQPDVARAGCRAANQARHIPLVADRVAGVTAANLVERPADDQVAVGIERHVLHVVDGVVQAAARQAGKLVVGGVHERGVEHPVAVEPGHAETAGAVERREEAAEIDAAVLRQRDAVHRAVGAGADVKALVHRAVRVQPGDAVAGNQVHMAEGTTDQDLAVRLDGHGVNRVVRAVHRLEGWVDGAVGQQPGQTASAEFAEIFKPAADEDGAVGLHGHGVDRAVEFLLHHKRAVQLAVLGQAGDVFAIDVGHGGELAADQHLAVNLRDDIAHRGVGPGAGIEGGIDRAVIIDPGDRVAHRAVVRGEAAANQRLAAGQRNDAADVVIGAGADHVTGIERPVDIEPGQAVPHHRVERGEIATDEDAAIRLDGHGVNIVVGTRRAVERRGCEQMVVGIELAIRRTGRLLGGQVKERVWDSGLLSRCRVDDGDRRRLDRMIHQVVIAHDGDLGVILTRHTVRQPPIGIVANIRKCI